MAANIVQCYNIGCGKKFDLRANSSDACHYHPGGPVFHDALKGWSCCKKRSTDFTEFLSFPGCATGPHSTDKPPEPEKPEKTPEESVKEKKKVIEVVKPTPKPLARPSSEEPLVRLPQTVAATLKQALDKLLQNLQINQQPEDEEQSKTLKAGTSCKHAGCKQEYVDETTNKEVCIYHPGSPIFHEGLKFWSCCQRKTSDFTTFLGQEGCERGNHLWTKLETEKKVVCRTDWHQTASFVIISIFAKVSMPEQSWVEANPVKIKLNLVFDGGKSHFDKTMVLNGIIDPQKSQVKMLGSKIEINLKKVEPGSWSKLELPAASSE